MIFEYSAYITYKDRYRDLRWEITAYSLHGNSESDLFLGVVTFSQVMDFPVFQVLISTYYVDLRAAISYCKINAIYISVLLNPLRQFIFDIVILCMLTGCNNFSCVFCYFVWDVTLIWDNEIVIPPYLCIHLEVSPYNMLLIVMYYDCIAYLSSNLLLLRNSDDTWTMSTDALPWLFLYLVRCWYISSE